MDSLLLNIVAEANGNKYHAADDPCRKFFLGKLRNIPTIVICVGLLVLQAHFLNQCLVKENGVDWWLWYVADGISCVVFILTFFLKEWRLNRISKYHKDPAQFKKGLPLSGVAWLIYSASLTARVIIIFKYDLRQHTQLGNLKIIVCLSAVICFFFTAAHHHRQESLTRRAAIIILCRNFTVDLLDLLDILDVLYMAESKHQDTDYGLVEDVVLPVIAFNLIRPAFVLSSLFLDHYTTKRNILGVKILLSLTELLLGNVPLLAIRVYLYIKSQYQDPLSVFMVKNSIAIIYSILEIYDCCYERRHVRGEKSKLKIIGNKAVIGSLEETIESSVENIYYNVSACVEYAHGHKGIEDSNATHTETCENVYE